MACQAGPAAHRFQVGFVGVDRYAGQSVQARHVVLVHMTEHHQVGVVEVGADPVGHWRRVEHHVGVGAANDDLVAVGVLAVLVAEEDGDPAKVGTWGLGVGLAGMVWVHGVSSRASKRETIA